LFLSVAITLLYEKCRAKQPIAALALVALMIGFVAKLVFEVATGTTLFVDSSAAGFTPLPFVHAVGGSAGAVALFYGNHKQVPAFCSVLNRPAATTDDTPELIRVRVSSQNGRRRGAWLARRG
jgi:hypothetical protein